ncbi:unnamed protein product [Larinioides sclopetarius]|uniref:Uncharacterized protein n=1 Tax=Larinioides sclopetarius TaxID=280406 RepID=A0AAV2B151_9ARAC
MLVQSSMENDGFHENGYLIQNLIPMPADLFPTTTYSLHR